MAVYTIIRVYKVPASNKQQARDRLMEALALHEERDYHAIDIVRESGDNSGKGTRINLKPPTGWLGLMKRQLTGK